MGCDIHLHVEALQTVDGEEAWEVVAPSPAITSGCADCAEAGDPCWTCWGEGATPWWGERNYDVFAMLAGVRNGREIVPLSTPRGMPAPPARLLPALRYLHENFYVECADRIEELTDVVPAGYWLDPERHSFSWLRSSELLDSGYWERTTPAPYAARYRDLAGPQFFEFLEQLRGLGTPDRVRIVFNFDF